MKRLCTVLLGLMLFSHQLHSAEYHVSPEGSPAASGTLQNPFATIQQAADAAQAGDSVLIHTGIYRESVLLTRSGTPSEPIVFASAPGEKVVLSGAERLDSDWSLHAGHVYKAHVRGPIRQVLVDGALMIEARWPNMSFDRLWDRDRWATADAGSRYGKMIDAELAKTQIDWTGAVATLNVAHQFYTWTRTVQQHAPGSDTFEYATDLEGITHYADKTRQWEDDRYYLTGKLEALDAAGEWFYDRDAGLLYLWVPDGRDPARHRVEIKTRPFAFEGQNIGHVHLVGLRLEACTFEFSRSPSSDDRCLPCPLSQRNATDQRPRGRRIRHGRDNDPRKR